MTLYLLGMPKKKPIRQTPETLTNCSKELALVAADLAAIGAQIEQAGFKELFIMNSTQLEDALEFAGNFNAAAKKALRLAKQERGDMGVKVASESRTQRPKNKDLGSAKGRKTDT